MLNKGDLTIRPATPADQRAIRRMVYEAGLDPTHLHWRNFVVAEQMGKIVGIGQVRPYPRCRELGSLVVREDRRGEGIARRIIEHLLARETGEVYLECAERLVPFYRRFGFEPIPWQHAPMPLRLKAGLGSTIGKLFKVRLAVMRHSEG